MYFLRNFLAPGYQSVIRGMEKKELCCAIFSGDVTPSILLKVALTCAQTNSIPAIVIPDLKSITSSALGFATMALGFKVRKGLDIKIHGKHQTHFNYI